LSLRELLRDPALRKDWTARSTVARLAPMIRITSQQPYAELHRFVWGVLQAWVTYGVTKLTNRSYTSTTSPFRSPKVSSALYGHFVGRACSLISSCSGWMHYASTKTTSWSAQLKYSKVYFP